MLLAKFYQHEFSNEVIAQREITSKVEISQSLTDFGVAQLTIPIIEGIEEDSKIELYEVGNNKDKRIFSGFIYEIEPLRKQRQVMAITARSEKGIMQKRKATRDFDYTQGVDVGFIINVLLEEFNANYNDKRTNEVRFSEPVSMEIKMKDTYFDVFDEIAENTESYWDIVDGKVIFAKEIGVHKPQTIIYEGSSDNPGNITELSSKGTAISCNVVIVEDTEGNTSISKTYFQGGDFLKGIGVVSVRNGNIKESAEIQAKKLSKPQRNFHISVSDGSLEANIGDYVNVDISNTNKYFNYKGEAIISEKEIVYDNAKKTISYSIGEFSVYPYTITQWQKDINKSIRLLNLKNISTDAE